jgi:L-aminopeptidase/D-esterase-like protein
MISATPLGSITDVAGIRVGHHQRIGRGWQSGTTVVLAPGGATPGVDVRGGGPGTRETDALGPDNLVEEIHAVCLTGGSAYGLAAAHGVMEWLEERRLGFPIGPADAATPHVVPVVPAAVIFDLGRGGSFANRPDATFGRKAVSEARVRQARWGSVGAGAGARAGGLQGGVGTASAVVRIPGVEGEPEVVVTVGALAVVNANGAVVDAATGLPWEPCGLIGRRPSKVERASLVELLDGQAIPRTTGSLNTTIGVVATSAVLSKAEVGKFASVAHDGMARAIRPAHSMFDGDTIFGLATGDVELHGTETRLRVPGSRNGAFNLLLAAAAETFAAACTHAITSATTVGELPCYFDMCPSTRRSRTRRSQTRTT